MPNRRIDVFFYGLFMDADVLGSKGLSPQNIRRAEAPGFALRIGNRATLSRDRNSCAYGMLMELTHEEIEKLYSEDSVRAYRPEAILAQLDDGSRVPALCFNLAESPHPHERNSEYAAKLRELARRTTDGLRKRYPIGSKLQLRGPSVSAAQLVNRLH